MPIGPALRTYLNSVDESDLMQAIDVEDVRYHVSRLRKSYALPDTSLARLMLELTSGVQEAMREIENALHEDGSPLTADEVRLAVNNWCTSQAILAAALTRKERGRPPL